MATMVITGVDIAMDGEVGEAHILYHYLEGRFTGQEGLEKTPWRKLSKDVAEFAMRAVTRWKRLAVAVERHLTIAIGITPGAIALRVDLDSHDSMGKEAMIASEILTTAFGPWEVVRVGVAEVLSSPVPPT